MTLLNVTAILLLSPWAIAVLADYEKSLAAGRQPVFVASNTPWSAHCASGYRLVDGRPPLVSELSNSWTTTGLGDLNRSRLRSTGH
jgi:hypothetical protein